MEPNSNLLFDVAPETSAIDAKVKISVELVYTNRVNFAVQQNLKSIFQELIVSNDSEETAQNLLVVVKSKQNLFDAIEVRIDRIEPQTRSRVAKFTERLNVELLKQISERLQGEIEVAVFDVEPTSENAKPLFSARYPITVFPWDEWSGISSYPSLLASFVAPNSDGVARILSDACEIMKLKGERETLEGYQTGDKNRVNQIIQAIYESVLKQGIRYANPPASFESDGQRIRFVDQILREKLATCLDLSLLFASALESCGLNPIVLLTRGHAFVGCHTRDEETFSESYVDAENLQAIRKRVDLDQIVVFETTVVANDSRSSFAKAENTGRIKLEVETEFEGALDVKRARLEGVRPLPLKRGKEELELDLSTVESAPFALSEPRTLAQEVDVAQNTTPKTRIDVWKRNLLDLTMRNKLLNFDPKKNSRFLSFLFPESKLAELEDRLSDGEEFAVVIPTFEKDARDASRFSEEYLIREFKSGRLTTIPNNEQNDIIKRLTTISRAASTSASESGVNSLFLTFGTVKYVDRKSDERRAPFLLIPVKLTGNAQKNDFCLTRSDEDATLNATLLELLRQDYGKEIRGLDPNDLPTDDRGVDVEKAFQIFRQEIRDFAGWELKNELALGVFSFQKFVMWSDLDVHKDDLMENPIVRHLVETPKEAYSDGISLVEANRIDSDSSFSDVVTPLSADSSQLAAILTAERGKSFVLQGPPGTGKSQTIANIIAHCLYSGRRILFVSEKRAALEVVYRRLCGIGLGAFCLELHSNKSGKRQILDQLHETLRVCDASKPSNWRSVTQNLEAYKRELNEYVEELHRLRPNGLTLYQVLSWLTSRETLKTTAESLNSTFDESFATIGEERYNELIKRGTSLRDAAARVSESVWNDLRGVELDEWSLESNREIENLARKIEQDRESTQNKTKQFASSFGIDDELTTVAEYRLVWELGRLLGDVDSVVPNGFYSRDWDENAPKFRRYSDLEREVEERLAELYRNGWETLRKNADPTFQRELSNAIEIRELRSALLNGEIEGETASRRERREFADASSAFYVAIQKISNRLGLKEIVGKNVVERLGKLIKILTIVKSPKVGFLLGDWNDFYQRTKKFAAALRARSLARKRIAPFNLDLAFNLELSCLENSDEATRLPNGIFEAAKVDESNVLSVDADPLGRAYGALLKDASALKGAAAKAFDEIGVKDEPNERFVSIYQPIFKALAELPPRSTRFLSDDWAFVAPRLRRCVESGRKLVEIRARYDAFNLNVLEDFDVKSAKRELERTPIPRGIFAFAEFRKQNESRFSASSLSLGDSERADASRETTSDLSILNDFSHNTVALIRAARLIADEWGLKGTLDETSALTIYRISTIMKELAAPTDRFLSDDWNEFSRDARTLIDASVKNEDALNVLTGFDLDKISTFDVGAARSKQTRICKSFFLFQGGKKRALVAEIATLVKEGESVSIAFKDLPKLFDAMENYVESKRVVDKLSQLDASRFGKEWNDARPNLRKLGRLLELGTQIVKTFSESSLNDGNDSRLEAIGRFWFALSYDLSSERAALQEFTSAWETCARNVGTLVERVERIQEESRRFQKDFDFNADVCKERFGDDWRDLDSDWGTLLKYVDSGERVAEAVRNAVPNETNALNYLRLLGKNWTRETVESGTFGTALRDFCDSWERCFTRLRELAPDFNAWKNDYRTQEETIRLETPILSERFSTKSNSSEWESVAETGNEIVKTIGNFFANAAQRETFLRKIDAFWDSLNNADSEDGALVEEFLSQWKRYEETSEKFFKTLDELPPETNAFNVDIATTEVQKIDLTNLAASLVAYVDAYSNFKRFESEISTFSTFATREGKYDANRAKRVLQDVERIDDRVKRVLSSVLSFKGASNITEGASFEGKTLDAEKLAVVREKIGSILMRAQEGDFVKNLSVRAQELEKDFEAQKEQTRNLKDMLNFKDEREDAILVDSELAFARRILRAKDDLGAWANWNQVSSEAKSFFPRVVDAIKERKIDNSQIADVVRYILYDKFALDVVEETRALKEYVQQPNKREETIKRFKNLDREYLILAKNLVVARLAEQLPTRRNEDAPRETELGALWREINAKRRRKSVRAILASIPTLLPKLKPCLLMSPLSVAQYFPPDGEKYDVVIFDEASQIPVWDAIGAIARGKRLIVVGDDKQLPPTNFFQRTSSEEEDELDQISEPESILGECIGAQIPQIQLRWHYRSKREGLIAFSNSHYYDGSLYTFPSVDKLDSGVRFVYVENGVYDRGGSKTNRNEARALVDEVVRRLSDPSFAKKSLGIVTFNEAQKNAIEDLLDEERRARPEIERFFNEENAEPVFVKNLENVQGDERDVMYFSICYGPDARGVVSSNFGPINKEGGERRLNVAITRAKEENVVFSSIRAKDVKLTSLSTERNGVRDLKEFLDYAESGGKRLTLISTPGSDYDYDSPFEEEVAKFLRAKGYEVKTQVGCSNYRIDLAIVAPDATDEYVVGIECDGASYHSSATARDRDFLRQSVLEGLGWRIVRVWSTRWFYRREDAEKKLLDDVAKAFEDWKRKRSEQESQSFEDASQEVVASENEDLARREPVFASFETVDARSDVIDETPKVERETRDEFKLVYPSLDYLNEKLFLSEGCVFYDEAALPVVRRQIERIVEVEGPITENLVVERIKSVWKFSSAGARIKQIVETCLQTVVQTTQSDGTRIYWPSEVEPSTYRSYRIGGDRKFSDLPLQEFFNAVESVKTEYGNFADEDALYREALKRFGVQRLTKSTKATIEQENDRTRESGEKKKTTRDNPLDE